MSEDRELFSDRMLEGEYTTWTRLWTQDYGGAVDIRGICVDNFGTVYATEYNAAVSHVITRANVDTPVVGYFQDEFGAGVLEVVAAGCSVTRKYVIALETAIGLEVYRYGVSIFNITYAAIDPDLALAVAAMSANGKYIAIACLSTDTANFRYVILLEGT